MRAHIHALALLALMAGALGFQIPMTMKAPGAGKKVLIIGGTRFSGLYLFKELHDRGYDITLFNRGKTANRPVPGESAESYAERIGQATFVKGDRTNPDDLAALAKAHEFDVIYDMNGREKTDTQPLADAYNGRVDHFVYMSSAGVYLKSDLMPHKETDPVDPKSRHKGKFETETYLAEKGLPFTSIRPTYIYGPQNYNPLEEYFFHRVVAGRAVAVPGHGQHLTGLGHVKDLATAMAQVIGREQAKGQVYNVQHPQAITFDGAVRLAAKAAGKDPESVEIVHYDPKEYDFGKKKAFPMRPQHFFTSVEKAMRDLDWTPAYGNTEGWQDSFDQDYALRTHEPDFECDEVVLAGKK
ncbi:nad-dependent epimerase dehydratase [Nannochloropsis gaditana CCMP526]|uniref:nad-dependent epimerase dehydratase n=1 Tax=Nannochloropsis gaditana (strain CCMP526) TaxID=1093141 RepID=UPI00029F5B05|nr:nad-dependent epimerase dehydratase [Nannochloropsis gaditana CCMP526]EKU20904.1 nad-dependent epimerase dehydratase [Nannochloropsis gaditana CCMP526]|eukprot:XP_005855445.1 nad-dependent epimerase dehydratase [Nannochloropsis gaditana CCMP526]